MEDETLFKVARRKGFHARITPAEYRGQYNASFVELGDSLAEFTTDAYEALSLHELIDVLLIKLDGIDGF